MRPEQLFLVILAVFFSSISFAQTAKIEGRISDLQGEPLVGALVMVKNTDFNTLADENGRYSIDVPSSRPIILIISFLGKREEFDFNLAPGTTREFSPKLKQSFDVGQVDVIDYGERIKPLRKLDPRVSGAIPSIKGDITDVLIQAPVNFTSELSSTYSVRGGSFDENLVYVNDIQVYRPFLVRAGQQEGLSFPNPDMVESIDFSAGGFEAKYGDRMSSVLDIKYRRPTEFAGSASLSLLGGSLQLEGISKNKKLTHNTGFRLRNNSYILGTLDTQGDYNPSYLDLQSFITYKAAGNLEINVLGNYSRNKYNFVPQTRETNVGNINEALRLTIFFEGQEVSQFETGFGAVSVNYQPSEFTVLKFIGSAFQTYEQETFDILGQYFLDELERDFGSDEFGDVVTNRGVGSFLEHARNDLEARVLNFSHKGYAELDHNDHYLQWGLSIQNEDITDRLSEWTLVDSAGFSTPRPADSVGYQNPGVQPDRYLELNDLIKAENVLRSNRIQAYFQDSKEWNMENGSRYTATAGVRAHYWDFNDQTVISPRVNFSWTPDWNKEWQSEKTGRDTSEYRDIIFTLAGGYYFQPPFYREMRALDGSVNRDIRAQEAIHLVVGADYIFTAWNRPFKLVTEAYYKDLNDIIPYEVENVRLRYYATNNSNGYATGLDVMLNGEFIPGVQSWLRASILSTQEDLVDDTYTEYYNADGDQIIPGFTFDQTPVDSAQFFPGSIRRPTDRRFSFSMFFQDEMKRWPEYKIQVRMFYGTNLPYGPPTFERYKDVLKTPAYRRVDVGFSRVFIHDDNRATSKLAKRFREASVSLEVFNILGINNTINYTWIEDVNARLYAIPNFLTGRRLNVKLQVKF